MNNKRWKYKGCKYLSKVSKMHFTSLFYGCGFKMTSINIAQSRLIMWDCHIPNLAYSGEPVRDVSVILDQSNIFFKDFQT